MNATSESVTQHSSLTDLSAIVTGASSGLGREVARVLALRGAHVGLLVRNRERGQSAIDGFDGDAKPRCEVLRCDLSLMREVNALADTLIERQQPIDLLFMNAGVFSQPFALTAEGHEATLAANYLGHFLLLHRLMTARLLAPQARVIMTLSTAVHSNPLSRLDLPMLTQPTPSFMGSRLLSPNSKVMLALMALEFSRRVQQTSLSQVLCVGAAPGGVSTGNDQQRSALARAITALLLKPVHEGAVPLLWAATCPRASLTPAAVYDLACAPVVVKPAAADPAQAQQLWQESERLLGLTEARVQ